MTFLTWDEVPANKRWREGDKVRLLVDRQVERVGYRLGMGDAPAMPPEALEHVKALTLLATEGKRKHAPSDVQRLMDRWWSATWVHSQRMGGPDRGVHVHPVECDCRPWDFPTHWTVTSKRCARVGVYYPPVAAEDLSEPGGLHPSRVVVIATLRCSGCWWDVDVMAGDLEAGG